MKKRRKLILFLLLLLLLFIIITILVIMPRVNSEAKSHGTLKVIKENANYDSSGNIKSDKEKKGELVYSNEKKEDIKYENTNNSNNENVSTEPKLIEKKDNNKGIKSITPSNGTLSPAFDNKISEYEIIVDNDVNILDFDINLESDKSYVIGNKEIIIDKNTDIIEISVAAEDGTRRLIKIKVNRQIKLDKDDITLIEDEVYSINQNNDVEDSKYIYNVEDDTIATVSDSGIITANKKGSTTITVTSKENENISATISVNVVYGKIKSDIYRVIEKEDQIVVGSEPGETIGEFIEKLLNPKSMLKVFDNKGVEITDFDDIVKTGIKLKLVVNDKEYDNAIIIVKGDINEDGMIDLADRTMIQNHILSKIEIENYRKYAADINEDDIIDALDNAKITNYIMGKITTLN